MQRKNKTKEEEELRKKLEDLKKEIDELDRLLSEAINRKANDAGRWRRRVG